MSLLLLDSATIGLKNSHQILRNRKALDTSTNNLSTGLRINKAADNVASSSISTTLSAETRSLQQAKINSEQAVSFIQSLEGYLQSMQNNLTRMKELTIQASSDTLGETERGYLDSEFQTIEDDNRQMIRSARYADLHLLDGSMGTIQFQIGVFNNSDNTIQLSEEEYAIDPQKVTCSSDLKTKENAQKCIDELEDSIEYVSTIRANIGAQQNRLVNIISNLDNEIESKKSANSKITDTDYAHESTENVRNQILMESSTAMMAQANQNISRTSKLITN